MTVEGRLHWPLHQISWLRCDAQLLSYHSKSYWKRVCVWRILSSPTLSASSDHSRPTPSFQFHRSEVFGGPSWIENDVVPKISSAWPNETTYYSCWIYQGPYCYHQSWGLHPVKLFPFLQSSAPEMFQVVSLCSITKVTPPRTIQYFHQRSCFAYSENCSS